MTAPSGPQPERPTPPLRTASLRRRVAVVVLLFLLVVLTSLGLLVNVLLRNALTADLKTRLEDRAGYAGLLQQQGVTGQALADRLAGAGIFSSFSSGNRQYIGRDSNELPGLRGRPIGPPLRPTVAPTISYAEADGVLTATVALGAGTLTLQTSEVDIDRTLAELTRIELLAGAGAMLVAAGVLIRLIGIALRPLERMTSLARRIRDGDRGRRLRPTRPGTDLGLAAGAFDEMLDALEAAEAQAVQAELRMRQFLADASHDLRTPLAGVIAGSEQLLRTPSTRAEREARLVAVVRQARRAARLVDDLVLMTRLDAAAAADPAEASIVPDRRPVDLGAVLDRELDALRMRRPDLVVRAHTPWEATLVSGDADQLHRALDNLLDNAGRVTAAGGVVDVDVSVHAVSGHAVSGHAASGHALSGQGAQVRVLVRDTGPGVPDLDRERIFDRFVRLSDARNGDGSGLGLPISRAILRAHGGDVRCLGSTDGPADAGAGARFEVTMPLLPTPVLAIS